MNISYADDEVLIDKPDYDLEPIFHTFRENAEEFHNTSKNKN